MYKNRALLFALSLLLIAVSGCAAFPFFETQSEEAESSGIIRGDSGRSEMDSVETLAETLRSNGAKVAQGGSVSQPFFAPEGVILSVNGQDVQVFVYSDGQAAETDAAQITPDGNVATMMISWMAPPHFFKSGNLIVLYVGSDETVLDLLESTLGPQFAGQ